MKTRTRKNLRRLVLNCAPGQLRDVTTGRCGPGVGVDIPRKEMPQILSADLPAFVAYAREKHVSVERMNWPADDLSPTQKEFRQERVDAIPESALNEPVIVSRDKYVLDGTHRWVKQWQQDKTSTVPTWTIDAGLKQALDLMRSFPWAKFVENAFNPDQPRNPDGTWGDGNGIIKDKYGVEYPVLFEKDRRTYSIGVPGKGHLLTRGVSVGSAQMKNNGEGVSAVGVHGEFQRKGLASALYDHIEKHIGKPLKENWGTTTDGEAFWKARKGKLTKNVHRNPLKYDPTRTVTLRRAFRSKLHRQFSALKVAVMKLVGDEDAFGIGTTRNVFCATGEGGGVDPSCSSGGGLASVGVGRSIDLSGEILYRSGDVREASGGYQAIGAGTYFGHTESEVAGYGGKVSKINGPRGKVLEVSGDSDMDVVRGKAKEWSEANVKEHLAKVSRGEEKIDSYRVAKAYHPAEQVREYLKFQGFVGLRYKQVDKGRDHHDQTVLFDPPSTANTRWQYESNPDAVNRFQEWLKTQIKSTVRSRTMDQLWDAYIQAGFKKGVARSFDDYSRNKPDWGEKLDFYAGSRKQFLESSFRQPVSRDKVKLLAGRTFDELENVTKDMSTKMSRALVDGLIAGKGRREVADDIVKAVGLSETRANTIAQTELIRAHAEGQLMALDSLGVEELGVMVEWSTAGDSAVCDECEPLEGVVLKMDEAQGMIPRHPNCRCSWMPANVGEDKKDQTRGKSDIGAAVKESRGKDKDWGPAKAISADRPVSQVKTTNSLDALSYYLTDNAFCPTGEGGGVDPTCSPGEPSTDKFAGLKTSARLDFPIQEGIKPKSDNCGKFGDCTNQAFKEYQKSGADVYHGYAIEKKTLERAKETYKKFVKEYGEDQIGPNASGATAIPHSWNVLKGKIIDHAFGSEDAKDYVYFGVKVPKEKLDKMKHGDEIAHIFPFSEVSV